MTFKRAVKAVSLLAAVLLAVPAFAGTATYLGTHTASDVQIDGADFLDLGAGFGPSLVTYTGGLIVFETIDPGVFSGVQLPDSLGNAIELTGDGTYTVVIDSIDIADMSADADFLGFYLDETGANTSQVFFGITPDGSGGWNAGPGERQAESKARAKEEDSSRAAGALGRRRLSFATYMPRRVEWSPRIGTMSWSFS